ncbi:hypothetical protein RCJ22_03970, partial [Vibrio sp. FNV 38]|nr:hypothetical protein [Vibrio sp. FNV 38]
VQKRQKYILYWSAAWLLFSLHFALPGLSGAVDSGLLARTLNPLLYGLAGLVFFLGTQLYALKKPALPGTGISAALLLAWSLASATHLVPLSPFVLVGLIYLGVGLLFWRESQSQETIADRLLAYGFAAWGLLLFAGYTEIPVL